MKLFFRLLLSVVAITILAIVGLLVYATLNDYNPRTVEVITDKPNAMAISDSTFTFMIWNIGYAGLGADMDFFYDRGQQVRTTKEITHANINNIVNYVSQNDSIDFFLFQEIDLHSRRSYYTNQEDSIATALPGFSHYFAHNYKVAFVPKPIHNPYGAVESGLASFSRFEAKKAERHPFLGNFSWPVGVFMLDRCFLVKYFPLASGKDLIVINTHNSAFDDGSLRAKQNQQLRHFLQKQEELGNYVVVGGDWNQLPANYKPKFKNTVKCNTKQVELDPVFLPDWKFMHGSEVPTNRQLNAPFTEQNTYQSVIDFFLVSPNIEAISVKNISLNFENSDHNPVVLSVKLKTQKQ